MGKGRWRISALRLVEVQKAGRLAENPKRQSLVGGGLERAEPFGGYEVEKKCGQTSIVLELGYKFWGEFSHILLASLLPENGFPEAKKSDF